MQHEIKRFNKLVKEAFRNLENYLIESGLIDIKENLDRIRQIEVFTSYHRLSLPTGKEIEWYIDKYQKGEITKYISELSVEIPLQSIENKNRCKDTSKQKVANKFKKELTKNATKSEKRFLKLLKQIQKQIEFKFQFQKSWTAGNGFYISDFYLPSTKTTIEIDGNYHNTEERKEKDLLKEQYLQKRHVKTIRLHNDEVYKMTVETLINWLIRKKVIII